jgi:hypothetical protein
MSLLRKVMEKALAKLILPPSGEGGECSEPDGGGG